MRYAFYPAGVLLCLAVVVDADEQESVGVPKDLVGILPAVYLVDGCVGIPVHLQFEDDGRRVDVLAGQEHDVGKALAACQLAVHHIVVSGIVVGYGEHAGQGVLVVVGEDAGVLVVSGINTAADGLFVAVESGP